MRLLTIPISHYCERARWALDHRGITYEERQHLQAFIHGALRRSGAGRTAPALITPDGVLKESADIIRWADVHGYGAPLVSLRYNPVRAPQWQRVMMRAGYRLMKTRLRRYLGIYPEAVRQSLDRVWASLDQVAKRLRDRRPYLTGETFTAADLTFATMAAPLTMPEGYGVPMPRLAELKNDHRALVEKIRAHPAGEFAVRLFDHRPTSIYRASRRRSRR